jgi:hypothetical protein
VQELARDRVLRLEDVAGLDDHAAVTFGHHGSELVVVARDDGLVFHIDLPDVAIPFLSIQH